MSEQNHLEEVLFLTDRIYRQWTNCVGNFLELSRIFDINPIQAMIVGSIQDRRLSVKQIHSHGVYSGTNMTFNLKATSVNGYTDTKPGEKDRRLIYITLTDKGLNLAKKIRSLWDVYEKEWERVEEKSGESLPELALTLHRLERFLSDQVDPWSGEKAKDCA